MDFTLMEEQRALQTLAREFAEREVRPVAMERDHVPDHRACFPEDLIRRGSELGLRTLCVPQAYGGPGIRDMLTLVVVAEELALGDPGVAMSLIQTCRLSRLLADAGTQEQQDRFFPALRDDPLYLLSIGASEPDAGSDTVLPYEGADVRLNLSAVSRSDHYLLNGMKHFITNAGASKLYYVLARTDPTVGLREGVTAFLVPADTPGFRIGREHDKMGRRLQRNGELIFENARVPAANRLGDEGKGHGLFTRFLRGGVTIPAAIAVGVARAAYAAALAHAGARVQGGRPLREHQTIANMLADMFGQIEAARTMVWRSAWAIDTDAPDATQLALMGKVIASEAAVRICIAAMEVFGGYGYMRDLPMEKHVRDALSFLHSDGTNQVNRLRAAHFL